MYVSLSRPIKKTNCAMCNLYVAIDIEAAELRNRRSTCENYLRVWARDCEISFFSSVTLYSPFFRPSISSLFTSFSRSPLFLAFRRLTILNFDARYPYRPFTSSCFHPAIKKKRGEIRKRCRRWISNSRSTCLTSGLKITWIYMSIWMRREQIYERS